MAESLRDTRMKTPVSITLILVGGLIVLAPLAADHSHRAQVVEALGKPGVSSVNLQPELSGDYRFGCWLLGSVMVATAVFFSRGSRAGGLQGA